MILVGIIPLHFLCGGFSIITSKGEYSVLLPLKAIIYQAALLLLIFSCVTHLYVLFCIGHLKALQNVDNFILIV